MSNQKTYCINSDCPFKKCDKHLQQLKKLKDKSGYVKVASLDSVCRDYISYLIEKLANKNLQGEKYENYI